MKWTIAPWRGADFRRCHSKIDGTGSGSGRRRLGGLDRVAFHPFRLRPFRQTAPPAPGAVAGDFDAQAVLGRQVNGRLPLSTAIVLPRMMWSKEQVRAAMPPP